MAGRFGIKALAAGTALAYGRVRLAEAADADAERHFEEAARLRHGAGAPYEAAVARTGRAGAHRARGDALRVDSELRAAHVVFERIKDIDEATERCPLTSVPSTVRWVLHASTSSSREGDYWCLSLEGHTGACCAHLPDPPASVQWRT